MDERILEVELWKKIFQRNSPELLTVEVFDRKWGTGTFVIPTQSLKSPLSLA
jgi:hypothetical protein